ncbi:MAG TPA: SMP-30/gluconolactonase/LRE family protein [Candidatus Binataceae bacterium]|nr:SMP-30/gluconolactonase/LRE family protein [Candidatus Binataceae bacterium]
MQIETLASGYGLLEAPRVDELNRLYFSDVPRGGVYRRSPDGTIENLIPGRKGVGGMLLNQGGGLAITGRRLALWDHRTGAIHDLFASYEGKRLNGLNDMTVDDHGSVYVGSLEFNALSDEKPVPGFLYRIDSDCKVTRLWEGIELTNGLGFSADRKLLYHCDSTTKAVWVYDVAADRSVKDRRVFAKVPEGWPDGLAVDVEGGVWVAAVFGGEILRFTDDGTLERRIGMPAHRVTSLVFGGSDLQDLYIVTADNSEDATRQGTVFKMRSDIPGLPVPNSRFSI